jgi:transposase-like protein
MKARWRCSHCGAGNTDERRSCLNCGSPRRWVTAWLVVLITELGLWWRRHRTLHELRSLRSVRSKASRRALAGFRRRLAEVEQSR